jgi:hypothetical protein
MNKEIVYMGLGLGSILAVMLSWASNQSILWAILHFFCSWLCVIYWTFFK